MPECYTCILSFILPCAIIISCSAGCIGCCCYFARSCQDPREEVETDEDGVVTTQPRRHDTLKKKMVQHFRYAWSSLNRRDKSPKTDVNKKLDSKDSCTICWEGYDMAQPDMLVGVVKKCGHYFHFDCLWAWLENNETCPLCRESAGLSESDITGIPLKFVLSETCSHQTADTSDSNQGGDSDSKSVDSQAELSKSKIKIRVKKMATGSPDFADIQSGSGVSMDPSARNDNSTCGSVPASSESGAQNSGNSGSVYIISSRLTNHGYTPESPR